jgi:LysM repeat protein
MPLAELQAANPSLRNPPVYVYIGQVLQIPTPSGAWVNPQAFTKQYGAPPSMPTPDQTAAARAAAAAAAARGAGGGQQQGTVVLIIGGVAVVALIALLTRD